MKNNLYAILNLCYPKTLIIMSKSRIYNLLIFFVLLSHSLSNSQVTYAQIDETVCADLAFSPKDLPDDLQIYVTESVFLKADLTSESSLNNMIRKHKITKYIGPLFQLALGQVSPDDPSQFYSRVNEKLQCGYISDYEHLTDFSFSEDGYEWQETKVAQKMSTELLIFNDMSDTVAAYSNFVEWCETLKQTEMQTMDVQRVEDRFGEESFGYLAVQSESGVSQIILMIVFRIQSTVCLCIMIWGEADQPTITKEGLTVHIPVFEFSENAGLISVENWSGRLSTILTGLSPPQPPPEQENQPMKISVMCDEADHIYESGERVELTVKIEKLVDYEYDENTHAYRGGSYEPTSEAKFQLNFTFPGGLKTKVYTLGAVGGEYTFSPFAPCKTGEYTIQVSIDPKKNNFPAGKGVINSTTLTALEPMENSQRYIPDQSQLNKIIDLFKNSKDIPPNWEQVLGARAPSSKRLNDMEYGACNNAFFCKNKVTFQMSLTKPWKTVTISNGYNCPAYTSKTLKFLTKLRFGIGYDEAERKLLRGLDYGPIVRAAGPITQIFGEHQAVILYDYWFKEDWAFYSSLGRLHSVLDPWPKQRAENFTLNDFSYFYARLSPPNEGIFMNPYGNPEWKAELPDENAFPLLGGTVYWNMEMKELAYKYVIPPETGTPEGEPFYPPQKEEKQKEKPYEPPSLTDPSKPVTDITGRIVVYECPVILDISDDNGQHLGIVNGRLVSEIERSQVFINQKSETDFFWYVWLPEGKYNINIIGIADGSFQTFTTKGGILQYYNASIKKDEVATVKLIPDESVEEVLTLSNGEKISPTKIIIEEKGGKMQEGGGFEILAVGGISLVIIFITVLIVIKRRSGVHASISVKREEKHVTSELQKSTEKTLTCAACGKINSSSTMYCVNCGKEIQQTSFCEECGRKIPSGSTYCTHCGDKQGVA